MSNNGYRKSPAYVGAQHPDHPDHKYAILNLRRTVITEYCCSDQPWQDTPSVNPDHKGVMCHAAYHLERCLAR